MVLFTVLRNICIYTCMLVNVAVRLSHYARSLCIKKDSIQIVISNIIIYNNAIVNYNNNNNIINQYRHIVRFDKMYNIS